MKDGEPDYELEFPVGFVCGIAFSTMVWIAVYYLVLAP